MPPLLPFQAFFPPSPKLYIPGEDEPPAIEWNLCTRDTEAALYVYRQEFQFPGEAEHSVREGVVGVLQRGEAAILPHEETIAAKVNGCAHAMQAGTTDLGFLWLWCGDEDNALGAQLDFCKNEPNFEALDRFGCRHRMWRVAQPSRIQQLQEALRGQVLFLADGHHRYAAGWNVAAVQIRQNALRTLPVHSLLPLGARLPLDECVAECEVVRRGEALRKIGRPGGIAVAEWLRGLGTIPVRERAKALAAVEAGRAECAIFAAAETPGQLERRAREGRMLPPKSTDFFPKLAAGLLLYRHQNDSDIPVVNQRPGVRKPSP